MAGFKISQYVTQVALIWIVGTSLGLLWLMPDPIAWFGIIAFLGGFSLVLVARLQNDAVAQKSEIKEEFAINLPPAKAEYTPPQPALAPMSETLITEKMQQLFDRLPVALVQIDSRGRVGQSNAAAREFLRLEPAESPLFDSLVEGMGRSVSTWIKSARDLQEPTNPEMVHVRRSNGEEILQVSLMPPPVAGQGGLIATLSDATELKSLEAQFVQSQKMQAIGQLAGGVAHDFNNLLTAISGYCDLLLLRHEKGDPDYNDLIQITQNSNRAAALVGQLLAFSRKQTLQPKVVSVNEALSDLTHLLSRLLGEKVQLNAEYGKDLPRAYVDGRQIEQVIMNLVVNARDSMPDGGEVIIKSGMRVYDRPTRVDRAQVPKGTYVTVSVADTGCGIPPEHMEKLFEPFFTTKELGEGTGLGLSMAYGIVKQTSGFIFAHSTVGEGSEFTLLLPAHDGREPTVAIPKPNRANLSKSLNGLSVMLVEDEAPVRTFVARALAMQGVRVTEAASAEIALEKLEDADLHVDLIVSDVVMPGMDGPTWVVKAQESRPDVNVIFVSGYAEESFTSEYGEIPNAHFLPKPFSLKQLTETVRDLAA